VEQLELVEMVAGSAGPMLGGRGGGGEGRGEGSLKHWGHWKQLHIRLRDAFSVLVRGGGKPRALEVRS
jgi:hypothetical protein